LPLLKSSGCPDSFRSFTSPPGAPFLRASRLHPAIEAEARLQFLIGKPDQDVFAAMKAADIRVRRLAGLGNDLVGVKLMRNAFGTTGP
jgi:hypothetical protein